MLEVFEGDPYKFHAEAGNRNLRLHDFSAAGKPWSQWKVWTALDTYSILSEYFGWRPFADVIRAYRRIPANETDGDGGGDDADDVRLDLFARLFSLEAGLPGRQCKKKKPRNVQKWRTVKMTAS